MGSVFFKVIERCPRCLRQEEPRDQRRRWPRRSRDGGEVGTHCSHLRVTWACRRGLRDSEDPVGVEARPVRSIEDLDGVVFSKASECFFGAKGAWVAGRKLLRLLCYELNLSQPPTNEQEECKEGRIPTHEELLAELSEPLLKNDRITLETTSSMLVPERQSHRRDLQGARVAPLRCRGRERS